MIFDTPCAIIATKGTEAIFIFLENVAVQLLDVLVYHPANGHTHTRRRDFSALSYRISADGAFSYRGKNIPAHSADLSFVPAGVSYDRVSTRTEEIIVIHFDMLNQSADDIHVFTPAEPEPYRMLFQQILSIWEAKERGYRCAATAVFYEILARLHSDRLGEESRSDDYIREAAQYMQKNLHDPAMTIASLARRACVSNALFRRKFRREYGVSPIEYLKNVRMQYAASLLKAGYFTQTEIAQRCGYADVKYFRTAFRRHMGVCLSDYAYRFPEEESKILTDTEKSDIIL